MQDAWNFRLKALALIIVVFFFTSCQPVVKSQEAVAINWRTLDQAKIEARGGDKPVMVDFFTHEQCPRCLTLMDKVYSDPQISRKVVDNFIPVRIYVTKELSPSEASLSAKLDNGGECILSFLDTDGTIMTDENGKQISSMEMLYPKVFKELMDKALKAKRQH